MGKYNLPEAFITEIEGMLGKDEASSFLDSYRQSRTYGLRFNELKTEADPSLQAKMITEFNLQPVPWCPTGYYYTDDVRPGKHPYHTAGYYYIQEPSAMSAVELLAPRPGETVLDLAAAPGGKTTHIASKMKGTGLLVSNEIHPERAKILAENVERMGIINTIVTSASPDELAIRFPASFDRIMLDAPCSGEGMFRKDEGAITEWSPELVDLCTARQWDILQEAYKMLKPGGVMAYSTCTFNRRENEEMMQRFTNEYPGMEIVSMKRLWPHREAGEGHFVALLRKHEEASVDRTVPSVPSKKNKGKSKGGNKAEYSALQQFEEWAKEELPGFKLTPSTPLLFGESLYLLPQNAMLLNGQMQGLKIPRAGLHAGHLKKNRIEPAHALAMALRSDEAARQFPLAQDDPRTSAYLRGEALNVDPSLHGWTLVTVDGLPLGWGKASGGQLKNHLPKGLRLY